MSSFFPATLPLVVFMVCLLSKRGPIISSIAGIVTVILVVLFYGNAYVLTFNTFAHRDLPVIFILTLSVALIVFPGNIMNALLKQVGIIREIGTTIKTIEMPTLNIAAIAVLGIAPTLESLTGFGLQLFFTVPLLMQIFSLRKAIALSLLSMNIMPWGGLGLTTLVGAQIASIPFAQLSYQTSLMSFLVFPVIGCLIYFIGRESRSIKFYQMLFPVFCGFLLSLSLVFYNFYGMTAMAGVYAGITVVVIGLAVEFLLNKKTLPSLVKAKKALFLSFSPYIILMVLVTIAKIKVIDRYLADLVVAKSGNVEFSVFTSPGIFILLTILSLCVLSQRFRKGGYFISEGVKRALYPATGTLMFISFAQIQSSSGILKALASGVSNFSLTESTFLSPLLGMISGYTTGSSVGGNALFMGLQSQIGSFFDKKLLFSAIQNASAGHSICMSVPDILLILSIAQVANDQASGHRNWIIQRSLVYALLIYLTLTATFYLRMHV